MQFFFEFSTLLAQKPATAANYCTTVSRMGEINTTVDSNSDSIRELGLTDDSVDLDDVQIPNVSVNPQKRPFLSIIFIYLAIMLESFASHSIYYTYIPQLVTKPNDAYRCTLFLYLLSYAVAFFTGLFTDKYLYRYWVITAGYFLYASGYVMLIISLNDSTCPLDSTNSGPVHHCGVNLGSRIVGIECSCLLLFSLLLIGVGIGLVWGHLAIFGADQIQQPIHIAVYFHGYYFFYQTGIAVTLFTVTDETSNSNDLLVIVGLGACFLSFAMFLVGTPFYLSEFTKHLQDPFMYLFKQVSFTRRRTTSQENADDDGKDILFYRCSN